MIIAPIKKLKLAPVMLHGKIFIFLETVKKLIFFPFVPFQSCHHCCSSFDKPKCTFLHALRPGNHRWHDSIRCAYSIRSECVSTFPSHPPLLLPTFPTPLNPRPVFWRIAVLYTIVQKMIQGLALHALGAARKVYWECLVVRKLNTSVLQEREHAARA